MHEASQENRQGPTSYWALSENVLCLIVPALFGALCNPVSRLRWRRLLFVHLYRAGDFSERQFHFVLLRQQLPSLRLRLCVHRPLR